MDAEKMDAPKKDDLNERRREEILARRLGEALDRFYPHGAGDCPDSGVMAAYQERALAPDEIADCETHFAGCARCRKILAVLAASNDAPLTQTEVTRLGELVAARAPSNPPAVKDAPSLTLTAIRPNRWDWRARWLAPALGVAAVLAIWFAIRPPWRATAPESSGTLVAQAPRSESTPNMALQREVESDRLSKIAPDEARPAAPAPQDRVVTSAPPLNSSINNPPINNSPTNESATRNSPAKLSSESGSSLKKEDRAEVSPGTDSRANSLRKDNEKDIAGRSTAQSIGPAAPAPPLPAAASKSEPTAAPAPISPQSQANAGAAAGEMSDNRKTAASQQSAGAEVAGGTPAGPSPDVAMNKRSSSAFGALSATAQARAQMKTRSGSTIWRAGIGGSIERSVDGGRTYSAQISPSQEDWLAVSTVSETTAWLAGRNGMIARTIDGEHWQRISPPSRAADSAAKLPDWIGIAGQDADRATITARDGRRFLTADGGKTWQSR